MTLQINEIGIRMRVGDDAESGETDEFAEPKTAGLDDGCGEVDKEAIIQEAIRRTMKLLKSNGER